MNNKSIALNILQIKDQEKISHYYKSEHNKTRKNKVILLMITDNDKQHYLAIKRFNFLLKKKTEHSGDYCLDCFKLFRSKKKIININHCHYQNLNQFHSQ